MLCRVVVAILLSAGVAEGAEFTLPPGHKVVGRATEDGGFVLSTVPVGAPLGVEPARDCLNDVLGSSQPLAAAILAPVDANVASEGDCARDAVGLQGPVNYLEFYWTGDSGGGIALSSTGHSGVFEVTCNAKSYAHGGAGVDDAWLAVEAWTPSTCRVVKEGPAPSTWPGYVGQVANWNSATGTAYGLALTGGVTGMG